MHGILDEKQNSTISVTNWVAGYNRLSADIPSSVYCWTIKPVESTVNILSQVFHCISCSSMGEGQILHSDTRFSRRDYERFLGYIHVLADFETIGRGNDLDTD